MIVTGRFVFLHLHKSGGTFVNRFLLQFLPDAIQLGYHLPRSMLPPEYRALPVLGTVRNPWDYYVSWYCFQAAMTTPNPLFATVSEGGRLGFKDSIRNLVLLADEPERLQRLRDAMPEQFPGRGINLTRGCLAPLAGSGLGFYSFLYRRMYGQQQPATLLRTSELRPGLLAWLQRVGVPVSAPMREYIERGRALNSSEHQHYSHYYDDALRDLVAARDRELIARHDYRFETP